jgi:hypothetical protein
MSLQVIEGSGSHRHKDTTTQIAHSGDVLCTQLPPCDLTLCHDEFCMHLDVQCFQVGRLLLQGRALFRQRALPSVRTLFLLTAVMSEISRLVHNFGQVGKALLHYSLSRAYVFLLDFEDLRTAADGVYQNTGKETDGDTSVVAADSEVYEIPALGPCREARARRELHNHEDVVQDCGNQEVRISGLYAITEPDVEEEPDAGDGWSVVSSCNMR